MAEPAALIFPFFSLPYEIRLMIYDLLVLPSKDCWIDLTPGPERSTPPSGTWCPSCQPHRYVARTECQRHKRHIPAAGQLIRVSRSLNTEFLPLLYRDRIFYHSATLSFSSNQPIPSSLPVLSAHLLSVLHLGAGSLTACSATITWPAMLLALPRLRKFIFSPKLPADDTDGCRHASCSVWTPCKAHVTAFRIRVLRFCQTVVRSHAVLRKVAEYKHGRRTGWRLKGEGSFMCRHVSDWKQSWACPQATDATEFDDDYKLTGYVLQETQIDVDQLLSKVKVVIVKVKEKTYRVPVAINERPAWRT